MRMLLDGAKSFFQGLNRGPVWVRIWVGILIVVNGIAPLFFLSETAAQVMLIAFVAGSLVGFIICATVGFSRLLGLMHAPWIPALYVMSAALLSGSATGPFVVWLITALAVSVVSLVMDIRDVGLYWKAIREPDE